MKKILLALLLALTLCFATISLGSEISEKEKMKNNILSRACLVDAIELAFFVQDTTKFNEGDRILNQSVDSSGNFKTVKALKTSGFECDYSPVGVRTACVRDEEKFILRNDIFNSGNDPIELIFATMKSKDGGFLPFAAIKNTHRGVTCIKQGNLMKVVVMDYSLTVNCDTANIVDSNLPSQFKRPVIDVITGPNFTAKLNLLPEDASIFPQMPFTDLGDILKILLDSTPSKKNERRL